MGNSNSQLKRSRSQYGSTRSVAFSLPSTWNRRSYAYGEPPSRRSSSAASIKSVPPKPILRNSSSVSSSKTFSTYGSELRQQRLSRSMHSLRDASDSESGRQANLSRPSSISNLSHHSDLSHRDYNDIYLNNDLRRVFRVQNRPYSVAQLENVDSEDIYNSTASLDKRLLTLKEQRKSFSNNAYYQQLSEESRSDGASKRRIRNRKSKLAPPIPDSIHLSQNDRASTKSSGMFRKKAAAPQPPLKEKARSLSSLVMTDTELQRWQNSTQKSLFQEIEAELLARKNTPLSPVRDIEIPKPDYDVHQSTPENFSSNAQQLNKPAITAKKPKLQAPAVPVKPTFIGQNKRSLSVTKSAVSQTSNPGEAEEFIGKTIVTDVEVHTQPVLIPRKPVVEPVVAKEVREMAVQYDAPVDIAIQCDENTFKDQKSKPNESATSDTSLNELLQLFNEAIQAGKGDIEHTPEESSASQYKDADRHSLSSDGGSSRSRNSNQQKVIPMHEVLAGVPEPPPLPDLNVKLIQTRTIRENAPISMAPAESLPTLDTHDDCSLSESPRNFSVFQQELRTAYDKIEKKRKNNPTPANHKVVHRQSSNTSSEANALQVYRHAPTIMGVQISQETGSDSGHDEPSDCSNSQGTPSIPDFVLAGIAKSIQNEPEIPPTKLSKGSVKSNKFKFNSIKQLKRSVRQLVSSKSRHFQSNDDLILDDEEQPLPYCDDNWTLSGRSRTSRPAITQPDTFSPQPTIAHKSNSSNNISVKVDTFPVQQISPNVHLSKSSSQFKQTNMKSFSLLTPLEYPSSSPKTPEKSSTSASSASYRKASTLHREDSLADVPL